MAPTTRRACRVSREAGCVRHGPESVGGGWLQANHIAMGLIIAFTGIAVVNTW
ncbi:hypothetical protein [Streptomyces niveus]|uniref:hypothetical protein n=1 Tax=Streptomyces niveus TaxID=193462 RepID=UPI0036D2775E